VISAYESVYFSEMQLSHPGFMLHTRLLKDAD